MSKTNQNLDLTKLPKGLDKKLFLALPEMKNIRTTLLWTGIVEIFAGILTVRAVTYVPFMIIPVILDIVLGIIEIKTKSPDIAIAIAVESAVMLVVTYLFGGAVPSIIILLLAVISSVNFNKMWKAYAQIKNDGDVTIGAYHPEPSKPKDPPDGGGGGTVWHQGSGGIYLEGEYPPEKYIKAIRIWMIVSCVLLGCCTIGIGLAWTIPITVNIFKKIKTHEPISFNMKIVTLLFVSPIAGIMMIMRNDM